VDTRHRWFAVGHSTDDDPRRSGRAAAGRALQGTDPALLVVLMAGRGDPAEVLAGIDEVFPGVPLIGSSSEVVIGPEHSGNGGVVVAAFGGPGFTARTEVASSARENRRAAGAAAAASAAGLPDELPYKALMLLTDGFQAGQEDILAGAYSVVGASLPMIGGTAGPYPGASRPLLLHGREVYEQAVVAAAIASDGPLGIAFRHGWRKVGEAMIVTRSVKETVYTLDDRPALTAYLDRLNAPDDAYTDADAFEAFTRSRPIGIRRRSGVEVRSVSSTAGLREGWLRSSGEVPEGGLVWLMEGDRDSVLESAGDACRAALDTLGVPPLGLLAFDCVSRRHMLGEEGTRQEVGRMIKESGGIPLAGAYTWGEIARIRGVNGFHNQTLAVLAVG
jgi:hypothetical protein